MKKIKLNSAKTNQSGFTLVETVVATIFVSAIIVGLNGYIVSIRETSNYSRSEAVAVLAVESKLESLRNSPFSNIASHAFTSELPAELDDASGVVTVTDTSSTLKLIEIQVDYEVSGRALSHEFRSYISTPGITQ